MSNSDPSSSGDATAGAPLGDSISDANAERFRAIPPVSAIVAAAKRLGNELTEEVLTRVARAELDDVRQALLAGERLDRPEIERRVFDAFAALQRPRLAPVLNATGVVIHTNLGRAPVSPETAEAMREAAAHAVPLEIEPESNERGGRMREIARLLRALTGAESALVVNNCASAVLLVLAAVATGKEVVVSRGEAVEIGGGFRVPDVLRQSGARQVEVGTTNRTYARDYAAATNEETGAYLKVHPSNFRAFGFVHSAWDGRAGRAGARTWAAVLEDLGSGALLDTCRFGLAAEPTLGRRHRCRRGSRHGECRQAAWWTSGRDHHRLASRVEHVARHHPGACGARGQELPRWYRDDVAALPAGRGGITHPDLAHDRGPGRCDPGAGDGAWRPHWRRMVLKPVSGLCRPQLAAGGSPARRCPAGPSSCLH